MLFHPARCVSLPITTHTSCMATPLTLFPVPKYFGITIQQDMDWDTHINNVVNKSNRMLGFLWCSLKISFSAIKERAYKAFVRPILEYASSVWDPYTQMSTDKLEAVQRQTA